MSYGSVGREHTRRVGPEKGGGAWEKKGKKRNRKIREAWGREGGGHDDKIVVCEALSAKRTVLLSFITINTVLFVDVNVNFFFFVFFFFPLFSSMV